MIKQESGKFVLYNYDGSKILGRHDSYEKALQQERAIMINKHASLREKLAFDVKNCAHEKIAISVGFPTLVAKRMLERAAVMQRPYGGVTQQQVNPIMQKLFNLNQRISQANPANRQALRDMSRSAVPQTHAPVKTMPNGQPAMPPDAQARNMLSGGGQTASKDPAIANTAAIGISPGLADSMHPRNISHWNNPFAGFNTAYGMGGDGNMAIKSTGIEALLKNRAGFNWRNFNNQNLAARRLAA